MRVSYSIFVLPYLATPSDSLDNCQGAEHPPDNKPRKAKTFFLDSPVAVTESFSTG